MSGFELAPLGTEREREMLEINQACRIRADFEFYFDRRPRFFAWPGACFEDYRYLGAFKEGRLIGYAMVGMRRGWTGSGFEPCFYLGDVRIRPEEQGGGIGHVLGVELVRSLPAEWRVGFGLIKRGNAAAFGALVSAGRQTQDRIERLAGYAAYSLFPTGPLLRRGDAVSRRSGRYGAYEVRRADAGDSDAVAELLAGSARSRAFGPWRDVAQAREWLGRPSRPVVEDFALALGPSGSPVAALAAWNQDPVRRMTITAYPPSARVARAAYTAGRALFPSLPPLPSVGGSMRILGITALAVPDRDPGKLSALLAWVLEGAAGTGCHLVTFGVCDGDPLARAVSGRPRQVFRSDVFLFTRGAELGLGDPYVDASYL